MEHPLSDMMTNTMSKIKDMIDVNTVVGSPITTPGGVTIIPVTKVSIGYGGGGSDFATKNMPANRDNSFGGGAGAGIKITPVAFLVIRGENVRMLPVAEPASTSVDRLIELLPDLLEKGEAYFAEKEAVPFAEAEGRIAAEMAVPYPPGIPLICPGERYSREMLELMRQYKADGCEFHGPSDASLEVLYVLKEE